MVTREYKNMARHLSTNGWICMIQPLVCFYKAGEGVSCDWVASGGLQKCAEVFYHATHDARFVARTPMAFLN